MDLRKDSDLHTCSEPTEPHAGFTMSRGPRHAQLVALITKPRSRTKAAPCHRRLSHEAPHCKWLHSTEHLLLTAMPWGLVLPRSTIMTVYFTPHPPVTLPQTASPVLVALVTLSWAVKSPVFTEPMGQGSSESKVLRLPATPSKMHADLLSW